MFPIVVAVRISHITYYIKIARKSTTKYTEGRTPKGWQSSVPHSQLLAD